MRGCGRGQEGGGGRRADGEGGEEGAAGRVERCGELRGGVCGGVCKDVCGDLREA
ncbi:hypothetical protein STRTUCAR8_03811 [Streptomyces turgidiscabies Car8]|uniref:Uncharacterized protein n=1 Tax=Streptomyces turgidiscabies (strain Car8) TaxID=698760 RepID=L7FAB5_STRT8|nr:hypothetical protein STRTUCAR8_03811 [Streptomyces turgidiscabies Car8]